MKIWIILIIIALLILIGVINSSTNKKKKEIDKIRDMWGRLQNKTYPPEDYENISHYAKSQKDKGFYVDDITWNDLEMDRLFAAMDSTKSSIGREYLYKTLRMPKMEQEELNDMDEAARYMSANNQTREDTQKELSKLGFVHNFSFSDYIDTIQTLKSVGSKISILLDVLLAASIVCTFTFNAIVGLIAVIAVALTATGIYFSRKPAIEPYFICLSQVSRMVRTGNKLVEESKKYKNIPESIQKRFNRIEECSNQLMPAIKGDWLIADSRSTGSVAEVFMNYIRMFTHVDIIHYNKAIKSMQGHRDNIESLIEDLGFIETAIATASFREAIPTWAKPDFYNLANGEQANFVAEDIYHPMLKEPIPNSIEVPGPTANNVLVTGSNASGKSTFLKAVAINALLSQSIATALASRYRAPFYRVLSSMSLRDDLKNSGSYYMVEIKALKRILDEMEKAGPPVLCFIDEVLRGTNTVERIAASSSILEKAGQKKAVVFAATHDIELTLLLKDSFDNYHFKEEMTDEGISFSYKLFEGPATTRNAIALLDNLGYDKEIISEARARADYFTKTGLWK